MARLLMLLLGLFAVSSEAFVVTPASSAVSRSVVSASAVSMFGGTKKAAPKKAAKKVLKKAAPKKVVKKAPVKKVAPKKVGGSGSTSGSFLKEIFSLSLIGGAKGL
eukprot:CAMPEP_0115848020 /NCGR_PEP_ID=MMETSP0287-20121206/10695_1 /TAXON_ID=412157 /ORGANISM="Chrysochromulina rotalis, Strain UIO044" /LENGTH=105 /DNA_ID=CAMNT_0003301897 /DNA_START=42 /DNA_END=359 /DNA_ORIENTATION=-